MKEVCVPRILTKVNLKVEVIYISQAENNKNLQLEIDQLKRELCHTKRKRTSSNSDDYSGDEQDINYRRRSRTSPSESFSYEEEYH